MLDGNGQRAAVRLAVPRIWCLSAPRSSPL